MSKTLETPNTELSSVMDEQFDELSLLNDELVCTYLQNDSGFFSRNPQLLANLKFADSSRGVVSLVERQQQIQRQKIDLLENEITQLMGVASYNEKLFAVYNDLYLNLIDCVDLSSSLDCIAQTITQLLSLADCKLYLCPINTNKELTHSVLVKNNCEDLLAKRLELSDFYFGRLQQSEKELLFASEQVGSVVLIKLRERHQCVGFLAINSHDPEHFQPSMNVLLLTQFRDIVSKFLVKHLSITQKVD